MKIDLTYDQYKSIVDECGGSRPFNPNTNNFYVYYAHLTGMYHYISVNDMCEAPERLYMDEDVAKKVTMFLNVGTRLAKAKKEPHDRD